MKSMDNTNLIELKWEDVRKDVSTLNPTLAKIIDKLSPSAAYTFFKASYPFGSEILKNGKLYLPNKKGSLTPFESHDVSEHIKQSLGYNFASNPVTFVLNKTLELFVTLEDRIIPFSIIPAGVIFGLWRILGDSSKDDISHAAVSIWDMTAGARSLFMLPKISEEAAHEKLKRKYQFNIEKPRALKDHWEIFRAIANSEAFEKKWNSELLFFSSKWFEKLNDNKWRDFKLYLLEIAWRGSDFWRNQFTWGLTFSRIHSVRGIKPSAYISDIVKHLLKIWVGAVPGFIAARNNVCAPISGLQSAYINEYNLNEYAPIIMQPSHFSLLNPSYPIYYSMQFHTAIELAQKSSQRSSTITELYAVNSLLRKYLEDIDKGYLKITSTPLQELINKVDFSFFHSSIGNYSDIRHSSEIAIEDNIFLQACKNLPNKLISKNSPFFNGCVRIAPSNKRK